MSSAPFVLHGLTLTLVWFLAVNVLVTLLVAAVAMRLTRLDRVGSPAFWLALRLLPATASTAFVGALFVPSYWRYEPRELVEGFDVTLAALALVALAVCGAAVGRGALACVRASRRARGWMRISTPLAMPQVSMPAYQIDVDAPMMALVGVVRPRLFITRGVLAVLTAEELRASVAHEIGHWRAADNLKRLVMRAAPDLFTAFPSARTIERRWASASEHVADRRAGDAVETADRGRARCALASALVKVARLTPATTPIADPISTLVDGGDIASRVHSLLDDAPHAAHAGSRRRITISVIAVVTFALAYAPLLRVVHAVTELIVHSF